MAEGSLIKLCKNEWTHAQRIAVAKVGAQVLTHCCSIVGEDWSNQWWHDMTTYLAVSQQDHRAMSFPEAIALLSIKEKDIRVDVLVDILALALHVTELTAESKNDMMVYDARSRRFLIELEHGLNLTPGDVSSVEKSIAQQMYYALLENQPEKRSAKEKMDSSAQKAMNDSNKKKQALKWIATGAGIIGGGAFIALTGGLAAPLLAPLLVGVTGATFFATAGGVALVTSLFGLTGGGLAGYKMHKRMQGISQFEFKHILNDPDLPPVPSLHTSICISGFLLDSENETRTPWEQAFEARGNYNDIFCLKYEEQTLLDLGYSFRKFVKDTAVNYASMKVAKATVLQAFFAAVALPATILKMADVIDNPWQMAVERSRKAGVVLADVLQERVQGNRPCNLIAYSCGTLVVWHCLQELHKRDCHGLVDNVVLMGAPISTEETEEWCNALSVVAGRFVNCYTPNDWVLAFVYRLHSLAVNVAGLEAVQLNRIENIQVEIDGHTKYPVAIKDIMKQINLE